MKLSIISVNFKVEKEILNLLASIKKNFAGNSYEVIIVEHGPTADLKGKLKKYPFVKYVKEPGNLGFGGGNNFG